MGPGDSSLLRQIQQLFERTYSSIGVNLEDCLIDRRRCHHLTKLAGARAAELQETAKTFLRVANGNLHVGIYYSGWLIEQLENHDPRAGIGSENIRELIVFVEEINHAMHAALGFQRGESSIRSEEYARNLELQASVDTYLVLLLFVAFFRKPGPVTLRDRKWIRFHLFHRQNQRPFHDPCLRARYQETTMLAARYTKYLESLQASRRVEEIRVFHALPYPEKRGHILCLSATGTASDEA